LSFVYEDGGGNGVVAVIAQRKGNTFFFKTDQFNSPKTGTETLIYFLSYAAPLEMKLNYMYIHIIQLR
jgi:hypothetical protein